MKSFILISLTIFISNSNANCLDIFSSTINAKDIKTSNSKLDYYSGCDRGSDLCSLWFRVPHKYGEVILSYDKPKKRDHDLIVTLDIMNWNESDISNHIREGNELFKFLADSFYGFRINATKKFAKHMRLLLEEKDTCEVLYIEGLDDIIK